MADEQYRSTFASAHILHLANRFFLEFGVPHGKDLVHDEDLRFQMSGDSKSETDFHTGRITFDRCVNISFTA